MNDEPEPEPEPSFTARDSTRARVAASLLRASAIARRALVSAPSRGTTTAYVLSRPNVASSARRNDSGFFVTARGSLRSRSVARSALGDDASISDSSSSSSRVASFSSSRTSLQTFSRCLSTASLAISTAHVATTETRTTSQRYGD